MDIYDQLLTGEEDTAIAEAGFKVRYTTSANLVNELVEAADERQLPKPLPAMEKSTCSASTNSPTSNTTPLAPNSCSRS